MNKISDILIAINSTFSNNTAGRAGGAIDAYAGSIVCLYHCTIDKNKTISSGGGGIYISKIATPNGFVATLHIHNCIITGNTAADTLNQITGDYSGGNNLIEGENGIIRYLVFGNNEFKDGYIMPLEYAKTATRLTENDIDFSELLDILKLYYGLTFTPPITANDIISLLAIDQRGKIRPDTGFVTFGAVEYDANSVKELIRLLLTINVFPNPTSDYFNVSFELEKANNIRITLLDLTGKEVLEIFNDFTAEGVFSKTINTENFVKGVYFLQILIEGKYTTKKIIIN